MIFSSPGGGAVGIRDDASGNEWFEGVFPMLQQLFDFFFSFLACCLLLFTCLSSLDFQVAMPMEMSCGKEA